MNIDVVVPTLPESVADATLVTWHKKPGERVTKNEPLVDLETDKVVLEVPAPDNGVLSKISHQNGDTVLSGDIIATIDTAQIDDTAVSDSANKTTTTIPENTSKLSEESTHLSPSVRRLIHENALDAATITERTGRDGRLTKADVINFLNKQETDKPTSDGGEQNQFDIPPSEEHPQLKDNASALDSYRPEQRVPMTRLRAKIAERLVQAQQSAAMLTTFNEVNLQKVMALRNQYKEPFEKKHGIKLGFMSFFVKATLEALRQFPAINASIDERDIIYHGYYDIGIAVSTDKGLVVPVLREADQMSFADIEKSIRNFGIKARDGKITHEDLTGGTFTITNGGVFGSMLSTPILNPPQSAILGMHSIKERPIAENGQVVIRPMMYLALSYDHRIIDGKEAVQFLVTIKDILEDPARLLLNL